MASTPKLVALPPRGLKRPPRAAARKGPPGLSPAVKRWIDEVLVPALVKRFHRERGERVARPDKTT